MPVTNPPVIQQTVNFDLTEMNDVIRYALIKDFSTNREQYRGMVVMVEGEYIQWFYEGTGLLYDFLIVAGPEGCCPLSLEFQFGSGLLHEIAQGSRLRITGDLRSYDELGFTYTYVYVTEVEVLS
jgi:hypothetical protein